jgi:predicted ribosome quality control (RQC) complex YloA/Tae2 family protein
MAIGLDAFGVTYLVRELRDLVGERSISAVALKEDRTLLIYLDGRERTTLVFFAEPTLPLLCTSGRLGWGEGLPHPPRLEEPLRECVIKDVRQIDLDRVVMLTLACGGEGAIRLYFELVPPFPNMFLADDDDRIIEPLFKAGMRTRRRVLGRGDSYKPPPPPGKFHPVDVTPEMLEALDWRGDPQVLSKTVTGVGPFLSREMAARAEEHGSLYPVFSAFLSDYRDGRSAPCLFRAGPPVTRSAPGRGVAWFRPTLSAVYDIESRATLNEAVEALVTESMAAGTLENLRASAVKVISREIRKWEKVHARAVVDLKRRDEAAQLRKLGQILVANLGKVKRGTAQARLPDMYSPGGEEVTIPLEPRLTPHANAEVYFKKARKALRRAATAAARRQEAESKIASLGRLVDEVKSPHAERPRLEEILDLVSGAGAPGKRKLHHVDERAEQLGIRPRRYLVAGGWTVLVGRSAGENDLLTHRYAAPGDLWFHARQAQGSHVVLRRESRKTAVPREAIVRAAEIAAYHSKARTSSTVPVSYTEKRYVRKVRKGPPGTAALLREKVIFVTPRLPE